MLYEKFRRYKQDDNPVIVAIDQNSINYFRSHRHLIWPWPRDIYQPIVDYLAYCNVNVISFDILFISPGIDRTNVDGNYSDSLFALSMKKAGNTSLAVQFEDSTLTQTDSLINGFLENPGVLPNWISHKFDKASLPISVFQKSTKLLGAVNIPDVSSGIIRKLPLIFQYNDKIVPHLSLSTYMLSKDIHEISFDENTNSIVVGDLKIPIDNEGNYIINWYGKGGVNQSFKYISFANLLRSSIQWLSGNSPEISPEMLKGKSIFIGAIAAGLLDMKSTPVSGNSPYPGIEIYATMYKNFQNRDFIKSFPQSIWFFLTIILISLNSYAWHNKKINISIISSFCLFLFPLLFSIVLFRYFNILFPTIALDAGLLSNLVITVALEYFWAGKKNRKLQRHFSRYLEPRLVRLMAESPESVNTSGNETVATVLFSDIKDFTKISSTLSSKKIVDILNKYFEKGEQIIFKHNGMLDKYTGDGLMALFGLPVFHKNHALSACKAIIDFNLLQEIEVNPGDFLNLKTRIGVHTGPLVAGNIGSSRRVDYTAIGSTVNIAARLEQLNKQFNTTNIISSDTCELVNSYFICRDLYYQKVKGIKKPLHIYTVLCKSEESTVDLKDLLHLHNSALQYFRDTDYKNAKMTFEKLRERFPHDKIAEYFIRKCIRKINSRG